MNISPYLRHTRPLAFPVVSFHLAAGFCVASAGALPADAARWAILPLAMVIWTFLNAGTLAINTAFDKDEGDIGYLFNPPPVPKYLFQFSMALMVTGMAFAPLLGWRFSAVYAGCFVMSVLYSVPPVRLKARAGWDVLINCGGYGMLTFYAGWAATQIPLDWRGLTACLGFLFLFVALYPLTQVYQSDEDRRHGDKTLAVVLGRKWVLRLALVSMLIGFIFFAAHLHFDGLGWRAIGFIPVLASWCAVLIPWMLKQEKYDEKRGMYRALWAWGLTDIVVVINAVLK